MSAVAAREAIDHAWRAIGVVQDYQRRGVTVSLADRINLALVFATLAVAESNLDRE